MITSLLKKTIKPAIHFLVLLSYLVSFVLPVNLAHAHTEGVSGASIPAPPAPIVKDQQVPQAVPAAPDFGDIAVDKSNPKAPQLDKAPNDVPLVNIRKPDARGLSHNQFDKFTVGASGVIFNNSTEKDAQSQLGGTILGNSALQGQNARIILTEVTGRDTSTIRGYLEVHGKAAELIIVNPNGIDVNGAGFINIPKATLSTGQLQDLSNGKPIQLKVDGGEITIQGKGLDLKGVSQFDIVTRKVNFDGKLYGAEQNTDVSVRAGKQIYDHESRTSQAHDALSAETAPVYAIDSSALGGMYAGKIALISTEKGVGVRAPENMAARMSDVTILANGDVVLKNAEAQGKLDVKSKSGSVTVEEGKTIQAQRAIDLTATKKVTVSQNAKVQTIGSLQITGGGFENQGVVASGLKTNISAGPTLLNHGEIVSEGSVSLSAKKIDNFGKINGENNVKIRAQNGLTNHAGSETLIRSGGHLGINTAHLVNESKIRSDGALRIQGSSKALPIIENHADGVIEGMNTLHIVGQSLLNQGLIFSRGYMDMSLDENMANNGWIYSQSGAHFGLNGDFVNSYRDDHIGGEILVTGPLTIEGKEPGTKARSIVNSSGFIETSGPDGNMLFRGVLVENKMKHHEVRRPFIERQSGRTGGKGYTKISTDVEDYRDDPGAVYASGRIDIEADQVQNVKSEIVAAGAIKVNGVQLRNESQNLLEITEGYNSHYHKSKKKKRRLHKPKTWGGGKSGGGWSDHPFYEEEVIDTVPSLIRSGETLTVTLNGQLLNLTGLTGIEQGVPYIPSGYGGDPHVPDLAADYAVSLDHSPLYETHLGAGHAYLFETRKQYADPRYVLGSDYFFSRIGSFAGQPFAAKRMGDATVETRFLKRQMDQYHHFDQSIDIVERMRQLYDNAEEETKDFELRPGMKITAELANRLKRDIIWMETEIINGEEVLVPRLYVSKLSTKNLPPLRSGIYGEDVILNVANLHNEGVIQAKKALNVKVTGNATQVGGTMDGKQTTVVVDGVLNNQSGTISGDVTDIKAKQILNETLVAKAQHGKSFIESAQARGSFIARDGKLTVEAGEGGIGSRGGHFAGEGGIDFTSAGTDYFGAASISSHAEARGKGFRYREDHTKHQKTIMNSGAGTDITFKTAGDHIHEGVDIKAGRDVLGEIDGTFTSISVHDIDSREMHSKTKGSWGRKSKQDSEHHSDRVNRNNYEAETGSVSFVSKDDAKMVSPKIKAAEVFELVSTEGIASLKADQSSESHRESSSGSSLVWQTSQDKGSSDTTVEVADVKAESYNLQGALGTEIDLKARGNLEQTLAALSQDPNMAWAAELAKDPAIRVQLEKEYHKHWKYKHSGMTPEFTIAVAIAIAALTCGTAAPLAGAAGGAAAAGGTAAGTVAAGSAVATTSTVTLGSMGTAAATAVGKAAITSAVISGINNKGDPRLVAKDLTSKNQMKSFAMTALTAGAVHGVSGALNVPASTTSVAARMQNVAIQRGVNVAVSTTIGGENLKDSLKSNTIGGFVDFGAGLAAQEIGEAYHASEEAEAFKAEHPDLAHMAEDVRYMSPVEHLVAHGVVGAGTGFALGQNPLIHAATAVGGELTASAYKELAGDVDSKEQGIALARFASSAIALAMDGDVKDISGAIETGGRAAENNSYADQKVMEGRDTLKRKFAQKLVEEGFISQEELDANFYDLTAGDLVDIYTGNKRIFRVEGPTEVAQRSYEAKATLIAELQRMDAAKLSYATGEVDPKIYARMLAAESLEGIGRGFQYISDASNAIRSRNDHLWIDPRLEGSFLDITRTNSHDYKDYINDYASVLSGNYEHPSSHRNLVKGSAYVQTLKDEISILFGLAKWGCQSIGEMEGYRRFYGNKKAAANGGDLGRATPDVVMIVTGAVGAAKGAAAAGKGMVNLAKAAGGATKDAAKAASRATGVLKDAPTVARASGEKAVAETIDLRVKSKTDSILSASDPAQAFEAKFGKKAIQNMSDHELAQTLANRADKKFGPDKLGPTAGKQKHKYAEKLLDRYQEATGQRLDLLMEERYINNQIWREGMGLKGSVRPDVYNKATGDVFDYKFGNAKLGQDQIHRYQKALPKIGDNGVSIPVEVKPKKVGSK